MLDFVICGIHLISVVITSWLILQIWRSRLGRVPPVSDTLIEWWALLLCLLDIQFLVSCSSYNWRATSWLIFIIQVSGNLIFTKDVSQPRSLDFIQIFIIFPLDCCVLVVQVLIIAICPSLMGYVNLFTQELRDTVPTV